MQNVRLVELLDEARDTCAATIRTRREESGEAVNEVIGACEFFTPGTNTFAHAAVITWSSWLLS